MSEEEPPADDGRPADALTPRARTRRSWPQRLTIAATFVFAVGSFGAAGALYAGQRIVEERNIAPTIIDPAAAPAPTTTLAPVETTTAVDDPEPPESTAPPATFPPAESGARNFLVTGADNNACVDPDSPYAPAFGDRSGFGERSDTIMMWRVDPASSQVAVLSFPRDLFVDIAGSSRKGRINEAYERDNPQRLVDTIYTNFGINTDHFVQVDFCAFKTLVDAVDGVAVPFEFPVRDPNTGLDVPQAGCFTFDGDHALAYVRSRKLEYLDEQGDWRQDGTSDLGRISRQQDFIQRTVSRLRSKGAFDPEVASGLIRTLTEFVVTDEELTTRKMLEFAGVMSGVDPAAITKYQIEARPTFVGSNAVLVPSTGGRNMTAILAVFQGQAALAAAPDQVFETAPPSTLAPDAPSAPAPTIGGDQPVPATTLPTVEAEENVFGIVPDPNVTC